MSLYLVATPIGNMGDITLRALETLKSCDVIACEDTRHTAVLLNRYGIKKPLISYYKHKEQQGAEEISELLASGKEVALVTDAGMPCVSDPGSVIVKKCLDEGIACTVIPGANALTSAIALSGTEGPFTFIGFLPEKNKDRKILLESFSAVPSHLVFYVAPHDLNATLDNLYEVLGNRKAVSVKEITKIHERVKRGDILSLKEDDPKGEFVLIIAPGERREPEEADLKERLIELKESGKDRKEAVKILCEEFAVNKNRVYKLSTEVYFSEDPAQ